jgi:hypothetical protein
MLGLGSGVSRKILVQKHYYIDYKQFLEKSGLAPVMRIRITLMRMWMCIQIMLVTLMQMRIQIRILPFTFMRFLIWILGSK